MSFEYKCANGHKNRSQEQADNCRWCNPKVHDKSNGSVQLNASKEKVDSKQLEEEFRSKRRKFGDRKLKGITPEIPGYYTRWVNDSEKRKPETLSELLERGYQFVNRNYTPMGVGVDLRTGTDIGEYVSKVVGTKENGAPLRAYLLAIRKDWRQEDRKDFHKRLDSQEDIIRSGKYGVQNSSGIEIDPVQISSRRE